MNAAEAAEKGSQRTKPVSEPAVRVVGLTRNFGPVTALSDVSFDVREGELTAILGENGAGKSTLLKILAGLQPPSSGTVTVHGGGVKSFDPTTMLNRHRVAIVPQELALATDRSVAENITMGNEPGSRSFPNREQMKQVASEILSELGLNLDLETKVSKLNLATQQLVVVARSLSRNCRILILDEPTAMLTPVESDRLFDLLLRLKRRGVTVIYVSHRMPEVFALSDQIHVLRDGEHVASFRTSETTPDLVVAAMVGRELGATLSRIANLDRDPLDAEQIFSVQHLSGTGHQDVTLSLSAGEVLGIAGLPDSGRVELLRNVFGRDQKAEGRVLLSGEDYQNRSPARSIQKGLAYVPGERRSQALLPTMSVGENIEVLALVSHTRLGVVDKRALEVSATRRARDMGVKFSSITQGVGTLSGGNQQKIVLARWLSIRPSVVLLDEPTRGVDVGAKAEIYEQLATLAESGAGVLCSSSDLPELLAITDRIAVMSEGRLVSIIDTKDATEEKVMFLATGASVGRPQTEGLDQ